MDSNNFTPESDIPLFLEPEDPGATQNDSATTGSGQQSNNDGEESFVQMKQARHKEVIIEQLKKIPIVTNALEKVGVCNKSTYYRWLKEDEDFQQKTTEAIQEGRRFINDLSENQLIGLIRDNSFPAISFWLKHNHPEYKNRLEVTGKIATSGNTELTPEQKQTIEEALRLASTDTSNSNPLTPPQDEADTTTPDGPVIE